MPSRCEQLKETAVLSLLNILLPTFDVYSDLAVSIEFFVGSRRNPFCDELYEDITDRIKCYYNYSMPTSNVTYTPQPTWGSMMLLPFLLNYLICWYVWATTDKRKAVTWFAPLLSFYPQYIASKVIWLIWTDPGKSLQKKRKLERNLVQMETFYEAVPSTMFCTYVMVKATGGPLVDDQELIFKWYDPVNSILFFVAYTTSIFTSTLGLAKNLKFGPCRILQEKKRFLDGFFSPQFVLIFFACGLTLVSKGFALASAVEGSCDQIGTKRTFGALVTLSLFFIPGFLVGLLACWHRGILKTFCAQPSVFLLPMFSYFTCASSNSEPCRAVGKGKTDNVKGVSAAAEVDNTYIAFSPKYTAVNAAVSIVGFLIYAFILPELSKSYRSAHDHTKALKLLPAITWGICFGNVYIGGVLPCYILGLLLSLVVAFLDRCKDCCCCPELEPLEFAALSPASPHTPYILLQTENGTCLYSMAHTKL